MNTGLDKMGTRRALTDLTKPAWSEGFRLEWMMPMPPSAAMAAAMWDSVTVSMGEETQGIESGTLRLSLVASCTASVGKSM